MTSEDLFLLSIDAFTPDTLPMARLADYLKPFSAILGNEASVHFGGVDRGSALLKAVADAAAFPKVRERIQTVRLGTAPKAAMKASDEIDDMMAKDNATGHLSVGGNKIIEFPGRLRPTPETVGPVKRNASVDGHIYSIGGKDDTINVHLLDGEEEIKCVVSVALAKALAPHLRGQKIRLFGSGLYNRVDGLWQRKSFVATDFVMLGDSSLAFDLNSIRSLFADIDPASFMSAMSELRGE